MEKLIELLNEYDSSNWWKETDEWIDNIWKIYEFHSELQIISKKYWFIKWLVENDKIDRDIMDGKKFYYYLEKSENMHWDKNFSRHERLLMLLSISDTPIEDLVSYLK